MDQQKALDELYFHDPYMGVQLGRVDQKKYHHPKTKKTKRIQYDAIIASPKKTYACVTLEMKILKKKNTETQNS